MGFKTFSIGPSSILSAVNFLLGRCPMQLSEEAEKWAASYRSRIPMVTDPQMARRLSTEQSRHTQTDEALRARSFYRESREGSPTGNPRSAQYTSVSEDDDEIDVQSDGMDPLPSLTVQIVVAISSWHTLNTLAYPQRHSGGLIYSTCFAGTSPDPCKRLAFE